MTRMQKLAQEIRDLESVFARMTEDQVRRARHLAETTTLTIFEACKVVVDRDGMTKKSNLPR